MADHTGLATFFRDRGTIFYVDISTLLERQWTGIPMVAAGLASALLALLPDRLQFFQGVSLVENATVADALRRGSGLYLSRDLECGRALQGRLPLLRRADEKHGLTIGVFPSVKPVRRAFDIECSVFHDLSTLVLPHFHIKGNVDHHMAAMMADIASDDVVFTVSEATRCDLLAYLGVDEARVTAVPNGFSWPEGFAVDAENALAPRGAEPYVLILGTREPRKNVLLVFEMLENARHFLQTHRFVFAGKMGWLEEQHALPKSLEPAVKAGRILFPGFVSDAVKYKLLAGAQATLYPSLFEGFGLPVLESLSAGTPCIASFSSSIPEVGGDCCTYFDPLSASDLERATLHMLERRRVEGDTLSSQCRAHAARFTWEAAIWAMLGRLCDVIKEKEGLLF
jgi:glycosyltransferase involved in cell wall biosynthesis